MARISPYLDLKSKNGATIRCFLVLPGECMHNHVGRRDGTSRIGTPLIELFVLGSQTKGPRSLRQLRNFWLNDLWAERALGTDGSLRTAYRRGTAYVASVHSQYIPPAEVARLFDWLPKDCDRRTLRSWRQRLCARDVQERWAERCAGRRSERILQLQPNYTRGRGSLLTV